ncbi:hypothetical protein BD324DRAFT_619139 [Kockovaella imperatae]|uniref:Ribosomal RNA-processing protein 42 n=1 Tax=Kockovaella imperatae TaxID=4999 RepID=A0A1Y1UMK7_9TREE|nr:hypothetical protein BD324DRAFT_619139 [Kockovaella imperatae]ORX39288.1 hypothetical protein BD324DRAFT_619139 [Kockovaella imperatae]
MATLSPAERSYIISGLSSSTPTRLDGRSLHSPRAITISYGDAPQANGSARVCVEGGTEIIAGIRLEVGDVVPRTSDINGTGNGKGKGRATGGEGWQTQVEVDVTPQAYPQLSQQALSLLSAQYESLLSDHFVPSIPPLPILPPTKYFIPHLQLTIISASSGSIPSTLFIAARAAFSDLKIPKTKRIGWEGATKGHNGDRETDDGGMDMEESDLSGIKAAVRGGRKGPGGKSGRARVGGDEWDLDPSGDGLEVLQEREKLPVLIILNLIPSSNAFFLDATLAEEAACSDRLHLCFANFNAETICGMRMEGESGIPTGRIKPLIVEGQRIAKQLMQSLNEQIPTGASGITAAAHR